MGGPPAGELGEVLKIPRRKNVSCYEMLTQKASTHGLILGLRIGTPGGHV